MGKLKSIIRFAYGCFLRLIWALLQLFPADSYGCKLRGLFFRFQLRSCAGNLQVGNGAVLEHPSNLAVGRDVYIGHGVWLSAIGEGIVIEDEVLVGPYVTMVSNNHQFNNGSARFVKGLSKPIVVGRGTWIGARSTIVAGVKVGRGVLVAAGAVVTKDVPDFSIVGGVPARLIGINEAAMK